MEKVRKLLMQNGSLAVEYCQEIAGTAYSTRLRPRISLKSINGYGDKNCCRT
jgi:hypothetical protein